MELSTNQIDQFNSEGFLFVPSLFDAEEIANLNSRLPSILSDRGPKTLRERGSDSVRSAIAPHLDDEVFKKLSLHPRLVRSCSANIGGRSLSPSI